MAQTITFEIPEADILTLESTLDKVLTELRRLDSDEDKLRQSRINRMRDETHDLLRELKKMTNVSVEEPVVAL